VDESDRDAQRFLSYLVAACRMGLPGLAEAPAAILSELRNSSGGQWSLVVDALTNALAEALTGPALLILDDYHFLSPASEIHALVERLVAYAPPDLHVLIATRHPVGLPAMAAWRARGELLELGRSNLAFGPAEVDALFRDVYGVPLSPAEAAALADRTEGWPIALQLAWQGLRSGAARDVDALLAAGSQSTSALFDYLAHELLDRQSPEIAAFLLATAVLRDLTPDACEAVRRPAGQAGGESAATLLARIHDQDLFTVALGDGHYRYHHLFHDFLRAQAGAGPQVTEGHRRAAAFYQAQGAAEEALYHWLAAGAWDEAAAACEVAGEPALRAGRLEAAAGWIDALPADILAEHPRLQALLGDISRLRSRFDDALAWYSQAERAARARGDAAGVSRALHGQASVYLDTVRPTQAESLLQTALALAEGIADREARARLLELLAENKLNIGKPAEAETLRAEAQALRDAGPAEDVLSLRVKLRTGQLSEARRLLEAHAEVERRAGQLGPPRAHRETVLLLSLLSAFQGRAEEALAQAREGIALGARLDSPFVTAVGYMRLGHARQLLPPQCPPPAAAEAWQQERSEAIRCYESAIALGDRLVVRRTRAEAMWGLTRAYGFCAAGEADCAGNLAFAERAAAEGIEIARWAGDVWVTALTELTLGASYVLAGQYERGLDVLDRALAGFRECGDTFGRAATRLWQGLARYPLRQKQHLAAVLDELLALCETNGYDYLLTAPTLLGPPDQRLLLPLLLHARSLRLRPAYVARLLTLSDLPDIQVHPGYRLGVQTLGAFRAWRGVVEITAREWQRDKARQLFQLLLTERGQWLQRDAIVDRLWPSLSPEAAGRDFKVALNALNRAIEPAHHPDDPFAFVAREGTAYRVRPEADLWLDATEFEAACEAGLHGPLNGDGAAETLSRLRAALRLYTGDYLPEALYDDWSAEMRERLLTLYLRAADRLAGALIERRQYEEALAACQAILTRDNCWEQAYRQLMLAHAGQGNRPQVVRAYQRCVQTLKEQLDVAPSAETTALYEQLMR
jgi:ATP/maltotriose-dependent transcriptional regulator MalT/DNA-binding SARP family transcriptional activator